MGSWVGLLELFVALGFALGFGILELVALRLDRQRKAREAEAAQSEDQNRSG